MGLPTGCAWRSARQRWALARRRRRGSPWKRASRRLLPSHAGAPGLSRRGRRARRARASAAARRRWRARCAALAVRTSFARGTLRASVPPPPNDALGPKPDAQLQSQPQPSNGDEWPGRDLRGRSRHSLTAPSSAARASATGCRTGPRPAPRPRPRRSRDISPCCSARSRSTARGSLDPPGPVHRRRARGARGAR